MVLPKILHSNNIIALVCETIHAIKKMTK